MSPVAVDDTLARTPAKSPPETGGLEANRSAGPVEAWLDNRLSVVATAVILAGFALRMFVATRTFLNPDEALHYIIINQPSAWLAYKASLSNAHPPLIYLIVYAWHFLGRSELMLRLPSVVTGAAFCWLAFKWIGNVFGKAAGLIGLTLCAFSPATVSLSAELRAYALLLFCLAGALYFLSRAFQEESVGQMWRFSLFLYLAILSHYSALFFTVALGLYALARFADSRPSRKFVVAWASGQAGALAIYAFLYLTHVSKIRNSIAVWGMAFDSAYFQPGSGNIFAFTTQSSLSIFMFLFGQRYLAGVLLLLFAAGSVFLFVRDMLSHAAKSPSARAGILLLFPFLAVWGAAIARIYPYVGSRHTVFLAPFAIAGVSYLLAAISGQRLWAGLLMAAALMTISNVSKKPVQPGVSKGDDSPAVMAAAMRYMKQSIPAGDPIVVDFQSFLPVTYYFCGPSVIVPIETIKGDYFGTTCNGNQIISLNNWKLIAPSFPLLFEKMARRNGLRPGERVWVYQTGWGGTFDADLPEQDQAFRCLAPKKFGGAIVVVPFVVGQDFMPAVSPSTCAGLRSKGAS